MCSKLVTLPHGTKLFPIIFGILAIALQFALAIVGLLREDILGLFSKKTLVRMCRAEAKNEEVHEIRTSNKSSQVQRVSLNIKIFFVISCR